MMLRDLFIQFIFGFPMAFVSLALSVIGVVRQRFWFVFIGAVLFFPFSYFLSGAPGWYPLPILLPLFLMGSALATRAGKKTWAWILLSPVLFVLLWVIGAVLFAQFLT